MTTREQIIDLRNECDEFAEQTLQCKGEFHPDFHKVSDERFYAIAHEAGAASRDAEVAELTTQRTAFKDAAEYNKRRAEDAEKQRDELLADAMRYRWIRLRIEVRNLRSMSGQSRPAMEIRIGHAFFDTDTEPGRGYLDKNRFKNQCNLLDETIDNARSTKPATANYPHRSLGEDVGAEGEEE